MACALAAGVSLPPGIAIAPSGVLSGRVIPAPADPAAAKTVWLVPGQPPGRPVSTPVASDGTFRLSDLPAGPAELAIETSEGLYVVDTPVAIAPGSTREVQLALGGRQDSSDLPPGEKEKKRRKGGVWANPVTATMIVVGSAIVVGVLVNSLTSSESEPAASPSIPD
ncbi:MAG TPA: hypothetical protein VFB67_01785 [Candidatus Polarisedimenticolaceae bacterium]|nr:hypothetical protein [Candidatus Polarisedimenticolaceae bacterium]